MDIKEFSPIEQVEPAVELGAVPPPLPDWYYIEDAMAKPHPPPQLISGVLHQGCKILLGGTSKSNKSWYLLDLALSVASGQPWWGGKCNQRRVIYINFELQPWAIDGRLIETLPAVQDDPNRPEHVLKVDADEEGLGGDDCADALRYLAATKPRSIEVRKLRGL